MFTKFLYPDPLRTREWYMKLFIEVANELGIPEQAACILAAMCCFQEAGVKDGDPPHERRIWCPANPTREPESTKYDHDSHSDDGRSVGICQQQRGPNGELWWGTVRDEMDPRTAIRNFMSRLPKGFHANDAEAANDFVQQVQRSGVPWAYAQWWGDAVRLYKEVKAGAPVTVPPELPDRPVWEELRGPWTGDPIWLADVIRREGCTVVETPGWLNSGHGDMGKLEGVVCHHTANSNSTWQSIRNGRPDLKGPLSQIHLRRDGVVEIVAVGVCWHAGTGGAPFIPLHTGNQRMIGIEAQNNGSEGWSPAQYDAYVRVCAAICRRLGVGADRVISHQEYDDFHPPTDEGKWDPGKLDMRKFRKDVQARIDLLPAPPIVVVPKAPRYRPLERGHVVTSPFGPRTGGFHYGVDFGFAGDKGGQPVYACQAGRVKFAGAADGYGGPSPAGWAVIEHDDGRWTTEYGHIIAEVKAGDHVEAGQRIGYLNANRKTNANVTPHLHMSLMPKGYNPNQKMDPLPWLDGAADPNANYQPPQGDDDMALNEVAASWSPFRGLGEKPHMTIKQFILSIDGMTHAGHTILMAAIGDTHHRKLLETVAAADLDKYPDRARDKELAQLAIEAIDGGKLTPGLAQALTDLFKGTQWLPGTGPVTDQPTDPAVDEPDDEPQHAAKVCELGDGKACAVGGGDTCSLADDGVCVARVRS